MFLWNSWIHQERELYFANLENLNSINEYSKVEATKFFRTKTGYEIRSDSPVWIDEFDYIYVSGAKEVKLFTGTKNIFEVDQLIKTIEEDRK